MAYQCPYGMVIAVNAAGGQYRVLLQQPVPGSPGQAWRKPVARRSGVSEARAASGIRRGIGGPGGLVKAWPGHERPWGGS